MKQDVIKIIALYRKYEQRVDAALEHGVDLVENEKIGAVGVANELLDKMAYLLFGEEGKDWLMWYIYENAFGSNGLCIQHPMFKELGEFVPNDGQIADIIVDSID